ncbi:cell wall-binding repeat-containing protein [Clostridium sp. JS66]|uniref:cell wall-binding repeat-containing protein n=1 Tax=Clostridium sp. JS66 TaxID=3064705 RepID=UPI00298D688D|nr:cell wall-binding repeat-containing protein [Clostridium sp. JS66]WPC42329.1 cell wall-binding repeat-containing protein [Clostridium sp. JS66]
MSDEKEYFTMYQENKIRLIPPFKGKSNFCNGSTENKLNKNLLSSILGNKKSLSTVEGAFGIDIPSSYFMDAVNTVLKPKDQGSHGSCGPHAFSYALELINYTKTGIYKQFSTNFLYGCSNIFDECMNNVSSKDDKYLDESGMNIDDLMQAVMRYGDVLLTEMNIQDPTPYNCKSEINKNPKGYLESARNHRIIYGGIEALTREEIKTFVCAGVPVIIAINITGEDNTNRVFYEDPNNKIGGHFLCVVGYDEQGLLVVNSWQKESISKAIWRVKDDVQIKDAVALISFDVEKSNENDFDKLVKDSCKARTRSMRNVYGASKKYVEYLVSQLKMETGGYEEKGLSSSAKFSESFWPLPVKSYQDFGNYSDISTSVSIGGKLGLSVDGCMLARNDDYVASSAGAVLCAPGNYTKRRYPLFLTDGSSLDSGIEYFNGHAYHVFGLKKVEILAGPSIISNDIENELKSQRDNLSVERIFGSDRVGTAVEIAKHCTGDTIIMVNDYDYPDLVCAGSLGAQMNAAILVNDSSNTLDSKNKDFLYNFGPRRIIIIGGTSLVSSSVESALRNFASNVQRVYGSDRYDTSVQIVKQLWNSYDYDNVVLARGDEFKNMSSAAMLGANFNAPVLLTDGYSLSSGARGIINNLKSKNIVCPVILGSPTGTISSSILSSI